MFTPESRERVHRCSLNGISTFRVSETFHDKMWGEKCTLCLPPPPQVLVAARSSPKPFRRWSTVDNQVCTYLFFSSHRGQALLPMGCSPHCCRRGTSSVDTGGAPGTGSTHTLSQEQPWGPEVVMGFAAQGHLCHRQRGGILGASL